MLDLIKADVVAYKKARIYGTAWDSRAAKIRLERIVAKDVRYIKPRDQFYPSRLYKQCFKEGKWTTKERAGHKQQEQDGVTVYVVPNPDAAQLPWEVETATRLTTQKKDFRGRG